MNPFLVRMVARPFLLCATVVIVVMLAACSAPAAAPGADVAADQSAVSADTGAAAVPSGLAEVPRNRTHIVMQGGVDGQYVDRFEAAADRVDESRVRGVEKQRRLSHGAAREGPCARAHNWSRCGHGVVLAVRVPKASYPEGSGPRARGA